MKTLGQNSVSSGLAVALRVANALFAVAFAVVVVVAPIEILTAVAQTHQPPVPIKPFRLPGGIALTSWTIAVPYALFQLVAVGGALVIVRKLKTVFESFVADQPFAPENPDHLRHIWVTLVVIEIVRSSAFVIALGLTMIVQGTGTHPPLPREIASPIDFSRWFLIFVVLVLVEVFRRGRVLSRERELTV
jgi:hypothetical protein